MSNTSPLTKLLRRDAVLALVGFRKSTLYNLIASGEFPAPISVRGTAIKAWPSSAVEAWLAKQLRDAHVRS
jgi:predicted DNA-binding transcriptional regulator AlpA